MPAQVEIKKAELLTALKANRQGHRDKFLKAQEGYRSRAIAELDRSLEDARKGRDIRLIVQLPKPEDHTDDYDRAIRMLEMEVGDTITLFEHEFDNLVMDQWNWTNSFRTSNAAYGVR